MCLVMTVVIQCRAPFSFRCPPLLPVYIPRIEVNDPVKIPAETTCFDRLSIEALMDVILKQIIMPCDIVCIVSSM